MDRIYAYGNPTYDVQVPILIPPSSVHSDLRPPEDFSTWVMDCNRDFLLFIWLHALTAVPYPGDFSIGDARCPCLRTMLIYPTLSSKL